MQSVSKTRFLAGTAIFSALSFIMYMFLKFPLAAIFPGWLDMQFSDLPALIGGFAFGPLSGGIIIVIKCLLKMPFSGTMCVGELADIIVGLAFVLPPSFIYKKHKSRKGAVAGLAVGCACAVVVSVIANWLVLVPFYATLFGNGNYAAGMNVLTDTVRVIYPNVTVKSFYVYYLFVGILPFNALRCIVCAALTFLLYKPVSRILRWEKKKDNTAETDGGQN